MKERTEEKDHSEGVITEEKLGNIHNTIELNDNTNR